MALAAAAESITCKDRNPLGNSPPTLNPLLLFYETYIRDGQRVVENTAKRNWMIVHERQEKRVGKLPPKQGEERELSYGMARVIS